MISPMASAARPACVGSAVGVGVTRRGECVGGDGKWHVKSAHTRRDFGRRVIGVNRTEGRRITRAAGVGFGDSTRNANDASDETNENDNDSSTSSIVDAPSAKKAREAARKALDRLLPGGKPANARDATSGETQLIVSAEQGNARDVTLLLAAGADPQLSSNSDWTAVHGAAEAGSIECITLLLNAGADLSPVANSGKTPLDIASQYHGMDADVTVFLLDLNAERGIGGAVGDTRDGDGEELNDGSSAFSDDADFEILDDEGYGDELDDSESSLTSLESLLKQHVPDLEQGFSGATPTVEDIQSVYDFQLDEFQKQATEVLLNGDSVVVSAPTGSGKTLVGETAIIAALARSQKAIYTTPLKALSNQKLREFQSKFGVRRVGLKTGDVDINSEKADIVIMTTEILRNMLYPGSSSSMGNQSGESIDGTDESQTQQMNETDDYRLDSVGVVILDEVHYLSDPYRGTVWEETIIYCPKRIQLLCLSATVGNPDDLAGWIEEVHCDPLGKMNRRCHTIVSDFRPVPLRWHFSMRPGKMWPGLGPLLNRKGDRMHADLFPFTKDGAREWEQRNGGDRYDCRREEEWGTSDDRDDFRDDREYSQRARRGGGRGERGYRGRGRGYQYSSGGDNYNNPSPANDRQARRRLVPHVETTVGQLVAADLLPAVWFIFSRKGCDQAAEYLSECGASLVTGYERKLIAETLEKFEKENPDAVRPEAIEPLLLGIASHHAGLLPGWKGLVENLFQRNLLKVVFATETLAAGVNMPARSSVLSTLSKRGDQGPRALTSNEFMQMAGRAGRRGFDTVGHVVTMQSPFEGPEEAFSLVTKPPENLKSTFSVSYGMVLNLVKSGEKLGNIRATVERSFGNYLGGQARSDQTRELRRLKEQRDALQEQLTQGSSEVEPEEWSRFIKLDGRLKEERRLLKTVAKQTFESRCDSVRAAINEWIELGENVVFVDVLTDQGYGLIGVDSVSKDSSGINSQITQEPPEPARSIGLAPNGTWIDPSDTDDSSEVPINERLHDVFSDDDREALEISSMEDGESPGLDEPGGTAETSRLTAPTLTVAIVEVLPPVVDSINNSNRYPLGEFLAVDKTGSWFRFTADKVRSVKQREIGSLSAADLTDDASMETSLKSAVPALTSVKWQRISDGAWRAEAAEMSEKLSSVIFDKFETLNRLDDSPDSGQNVYFSGVDDMEQFLTQQRKQVEKTRAEIAEMKQFSDLRRAVKMSRRREEKLKKLEERIKVAEIRVGEYTAAGWSEFTRVVDILIEQGALYDLIDDDVGDLCESEARLAASQKVEEVAKIRRERSLGDKTKKADHAFWDDPFGKDDDTNLEAFLDWEPDTPNRGTFATAQSRFSGGSEQTVSDEKQSPDDDVLEVDEGLIQADARRRRTAVRWNDASNDRSEDTLTLTDLGQTSSKLRGENELWLGVALSSDTVVGLTAEQIAGVAGALCCDSNRPTSCVYGPSVQLDDALESLMPSGSEIASLQFENEMDAPVNLSRPVAALVEAWAAGSSWDQVRRDTNLDEGDVARVFRRTAELLTQVPRTRELPMEVRQAARRAGELVLRPPITDLS